MDADKVGRGKEPMDQMWTNRGGLQRCFPRFPRQSSCLANDQSSWWAPVALFWKILPRPHTTITLFHMRLLKADAHVCIWNVITDSFCPTVHSPKALIMHYSPSELEPTLIIAYLLVGHLISQLLWKHPCSKSTGREQISSHVKKNPPHSSHWGRQCACLISASKDISHI